MRDCSRIVRRAVRPDARHRGCTVLVLCPHRACSRLGISFKSLGGASAAVRAPGVSGFRAAGDAWRSGRAADLSAEYAFFRSRVVFRRCASCLLRVSVSSGRAARAARALRVRLRRRLRFRVRLRLRIRFRKPSGIGPFPNASGAPGAFARVPSGFSSERDFWEWRALRGSRRFSGRDRLGRDCA